MIPIQPVSLFFDNALYRDGVALLFEGPIEEVVAWEASEVRPALLAADRFIGTGRFVAGYLSYEAGYALEPKLAPLTRASLWPLLRLFVFPRPRVLAPAERDTYLQRQSGQAEISIETGALHETWHADAFDRVRRAIRDGEVYQLNLTFPLSVRASGHPARLYPLYRTQARAGASALLSMGEETILSFSPETFFTRQRAVIRTRPMKGTAPRGLTFAQDRAQRRRLRADPKERAENLMIVDLLRNDISRLGRPGRTEVTDLFTVETFPRLHTMTSGVQGELDPDTPLSAILTALFPCGSVTGAPKVRAMELIHAIEPVARGPYCGAIGFAGPGIAAFNVAIRTLQFRGQTGVM
ncbi:MAG TPA: aminodeoxychorismate synthase, component I, partial [Alphaproteobacteria bacterium]|nr:aminodeoxychorismate synthase, component I [Alphaproteobacteria bacterium]